MATWSLGGRADGAIYWIAALCWSSLFVLVLDPRRFKRGGAGDRNEVPLLAYWALLFLILAIGAFNPQMEVVERADGSWGLEALKPIPFLPAALVGERAREYSFLLTGVMVQAVMIWQYLRRRSHVRLLVTCLAINALGLAIIGAVLNLMSTEKILGLFEPVNQSFFSSFRYHNHWTAFALLSLGQCSALAVYWFGWSRRYHQATRRRPEFLWLCAGGLISITLLINGARAGILFFAAFLAVVLWRGAWRILGENSLRESGRKRWWMSKTARLAGLGFIILGLAGYGFILTGDLIENKIVATQQQLEQIGEGGGLNDRLIYGPQDTGRMIQARPLFGWGFGNHKYAFYIFTGDHYRTAEGIPRVHKEFAHNDWLQFIAELGIIGFVCLIAPPLLIYFRLRKRGPPPAFTSWLLIGAGLILLLATFEFPLSNPAVLLIFFVQCTAALRYWWLDTESGAVIDAGLDRQEEAVVS